MKLKNKLSSKFFTTYENDQARVLRNSIIKRTALWLVGFIIGYGIAAGIFTVIAATIISPILYTILSGLNLDSLYSLFAGLYGPLVALGFFFGLAAIICSGIGRATQYFDLLFSSIETLVEDRDELPQFPPELSHTALALHTMQENNRRNKRAAQAAEQRKNELVVYLAHDIKTPLTSIIGYLTLLSESPDMPLETRARYAGIALDKAYRLEELIEEFFEITRYNLQTIPIERSRFDATLFCQQIIDDVYPQAQARSLTLTLHAPDSLLVFADANRLSRALDNMMKNALSYADAGSEIQVVLERCFPYANPQPWMKVVVTNHGHEISPERLHRLFEKFYRGEDSRTSSSGGSGLGLAIAREIAKAHGGDITAASEKGWTSFALWIPLEFDGPSGEPIAVTSPATAQPAQATQTSGATHTTVIPVRHAMSPSDEAAAPLKEASSVPTTNNADTGSAKASPDAKPTGTAPTSPPK